MSELNGPAEAAGGAVPTFVFRVYVAGATDRSHAAVTGLRGLCEARLRGAHRIEVIDVLEHPEAAEAERVLATPMVMRVAPPPPRRVIGDLSDRGAAARALGIPDSDEAPDEEGTQQ